MSVLSLTGVVDDEVFGLEVSVGDPLLVHVSQGVHNHSAVEGNMLGGQTFAGEVSAQRGVWDTHEHDELSVLILSAASVARVCTAFRRLVGAT